MTEQWQELKETITEMRDNDGTGTQQDACKFLVNYMETLEKQMQQPCEDCVSRQAVIEHICEDKECYKEECKGRTLKWCPDLQWAFDLPSVIPQTVTEFADKCKECGKIQNELSEDCISREEALLALTGMDLPTDRDKLIALFTERIQQLPPVKPKYTDEEIDRAQAVEQAYVDKMVELAVEETKRPKGKWIRVVDKAGHLVWECEYCKWQQRIATNFCPDCGAEMNGDREDEA